MTKLFSVYRTNNVLLTETILQMLEDREVVISDEVEAELLKVAREFGTGDEDASLRERIRRAA